MTHRCNPGPEQPTERQWIHLKPSLIPACVFYFMHLTERLLGLPGPCAAPFLLFDDLIEASVSLDPPSFSGGAVPLSSNVSPFLKLCLRQSLLHFTASKVSSFPLLPHIFSLDNPPSPMASYLFISRLFFFLTVEPFSISIDDSHL